MRRLLLLAVLAASVAGAQPPPEGANAVLLVAKPGLADPNFSETVVLATRTGDGGTVGVILNRPTARRHEANGAPVFSGGPVMREAVVAVFRAPRAPDAAAFHVLKDIYLTMHPQNIDALLSNSSARYRLYSGFAGWMPGQLESELARDGWFVLPANEEILFRRNTSGLWEEMVRKARGRVATL